MSNIAKLEFAALDISGKNYLSWILDAKIHLDAMNLGNTIKEGNVASQQDRAKALIFIRHHIDASLKSEYLTVKDPLILWNYLKERYDHQKTVILPKARYDWLHLRLQDLSQSVTTTRLFSKLALSCNYVEKRSLMRTCSRKIILPFMPLTCSCSNNIESVVLPDIQS